MYGTDFTVTEFENAYRSFMDANIEDWKDRLSEDPHTEVIELICEILGTDDRSWLVGMAVTISCSDGENVEVTLNFDYVPDEVTVGAAKKALEDAMNSKAATPFPFYSGM